MNTTRCGAAFAVAAVLATGGMSALASGAPPADPPAVPVADAEDEGSGPAPLSSYCMKTFASGTGPTRFVWCFGSGGNIVHLEHPANLEHITDSDFGTWDGYCLSSNGVKRGQSAAVGAFGNLNPPTYPSPSKVVHTTTDGVWRIEQAFSQTTVTKTTPASITITMTVTNISRGPQEHVYLTRWIDADMRNTRGGDVWVSAGRSVSVSERGTPRLELLPGTPTFDVRTMIDDKGHLFGFLNDSCYNVVADARSSAGSSDRQMAIMQEMGTVLQGARKTAKFQYRVTT